MRFPALLRSGTALCLTLLAACGGGVAGPSVPTPVNGFRPDDRVVIGDFSRVNAIASTTDRVYVVYPTAVATWHPIERRWDVPVSPPQPAVLRTVTSASVDPIDKSLWVMTGTGWLHYDPILNHWTNALPPPFNLPRPTTIADAMRDIPQLQSLAPRIATDEYQRQGVLTAAAPDPAHNGWFIGTSNRGLVFFDRMGVDAAAFPFGLRGDVVGAILATSNGIWVATDADATHPAGVTELSPDLMRSTPLQGLTGRGLPFSAVRRMLAMPNATWFGTDKGAVRARAGSDALERFDVGMGLPDERVLALASIRGLLIAGTSRGLATLHNDSAFARLAVDFSDPVYALHVRGDTVWVGSARGLFALVPGNDEPMMPDGFRLVGGGPVAVLGIGYVADTLVAMTPDRLLWRDPGSGAWTAGPLLSGQFGSLVAFDVVASGAWIGGPLGAGFVRPNTTALRWLMVGNQIPDEVTAIAARDQFLWVGTRGGLVRFLLTTP